MLKIKNIQNFAFQNNLWANGSKIIVGVSGGPDSICLLDILVKLSPKYNFKLHIAHVNYALRESESVKDEMLVHKLAEKYQLPISVLKPKKSEYKGNLESTLRDIRYKFFEKLRIDLGFDFIAVAHNQDDQAETVLMRMLRGSGLNGLSAIKPRVKNVIRPLLATSRGEILAYNKHKKLIFRIDESNKDLKFTRNLIRHKLLPYLEKNFNPSIKTTLSGWSFMVADDYEYIEQQAERFTNLMCKNKGERAEIKYINFSATDFLQLHVAIQRQVIRQIFLKLKETNKDVESKHVQEIIKVIRSSKNKAPKAMIGGLNILKRNDNIDIFC